MPRVSVIIPAYNGERHIAETLESVFAQSFEDWEIVLVNDGSTDGTERIVQTYGERIKYFRQENAGISAARNRAIEAAEGEYIALLDQDDLWLPENLEKKVGLLDKDKSVGLVYSNGYDINDAGIVVGEEGAGLEHHRGRVFHQLLLRDFVGHPSGVITRKECFKNVGMFNLSYTMAEEYDLYLRIADKYCLDYIADRLFKYRFHSRSTSATRQRTLAFELLKILDGWVARRPELTTGYRTVVEMAAIRAHVILALSYWRDASFRRLAYAMVDLLRVAGFNPLLLLWRLGHIYNPGRVKRFFARNKYVYGQAR
jgi:glycosyltransferase involved in cell wall biosynthesis